MLFGEVLVRTSPFVISLTAFFRISVQLLFESLFSGVAIGSVLLMAALGLAIVFGLMGVINLAHGELIMLGAYTTYVVQLIFKLPAMQPLYGLYVLVAIPIAFMTSGVVGILLERTVIRRLYGNPLETLLATWGVSLILQQFVRSVPLAQAAGLVLALVLGFSLPLVLPQKLLQGTRHRLVRVGSWGSSALVGVLFAGFLAEQISRIARATSRNVDVTAPKWMRGGIEWMNHCRCAWRDLVSEPQCLGNAHSGSDAEPLNERLPRHFHRYR